MEDPQHEGKELAQDSFEQSLHVDPPYAPFSLLVSPFASRVTHATVRSGRSVA